MTIKEFYNVKCGDKIKDIDSNEIGEVKVASRGEFYVEFPSSPNQLVCYDTTEYYERPCPWDGIELIKEI